MHRVSLASLALTLASCAGGGDLEACPVGAREVATGHPEVVTIQVEHGEEGAACVGTLIAPRVVLTAGHCIAPGAAITAGGIPAVAAASQAPQRPSWLDWESPDIGVVILARPLEVGAVGVVSLATPGERSPVIVYGRTAGGLTTDTIRRVPALWAPLPGYPLLRYSGATSGHGDSGAPVMRPGTREIVGVVSGGDARWTVYARVDTSALWIALVAKCAESEDPSGCLETK